MKMVVVVVGSSKANDDGCQHRWLWAGARMVWLVAIAGGHHRICCGMARRFVRHWIRCHFTVLISTLPAGKHAHYIESRQQRPYAIQDCKSPNTVEDRSDGSQRSSDGIQCQ